MNDLAYDAVIPPGFSPEGTPLILYSKLREWVPLFWKDRILIHSMEAYSVSERYDTPIVGMGICGLDDTENWENHKDVSIAQALVLKRLSSQTNESRNLHYKLWLENWP
jgi:hypothetical protein